MNEGLNTLTKENRMNNLKSIRESKKLSLEELGSAIGSGKSQIFDLEKQSSNPTIKTAYKIARVLDVSIYEIWPNEIEVVEETITVRRIKL